MTSRRFIYRILLISSALVHLLLGSHSITAQTSRESPAELRNSGGSRHFIDYFYLEPYCGLGIVAGNAIEEWSVVGIKPGMGVVSGLHLLVGKPENAGSIYWGIDIGFASYLHRRKIYRYEPFIDVSKPWIYVDDMHFMQRFVFILPTMRVVLLRDRVFCQLGFGRNRSWWRTNFWSTLGGWCLKDGYSGKVYKTSIQYRKVSLSVMVFNCHAGVHFSDPDPLDSIHHRDLIIPLRANTVMLTLGIAL